MRQMGLFVPASDWVAPILSELPDRLHGKISVDTETCDHGLKDGDGSGWAWAGGGHVAGYSVSADNFSGYLPIGHAGGGNVDAVQARRWLNRVLGDERQEKIFAHAMYDLGWAWRDGVEIRGPSVDVQWAEAVLDEHQWSYSLDNVAKRRLGRSKDEQLLRDAAAAFGIEDRRAKAELWRLPAKFVGPYATLDADLPKLIWEAQEALIDAEDLRPILDLEHSLIPLYMDMRRRGVRVDLDYAEQLKKEMRGAAADKVKEIRRLTGVAVDIWSARSIAVAFDKEGLSYSRTEKTNVPSITKELLGRLDHWLPKMILSARECDKLAGTFIESQVLGQSHGGRVHGSIHPLKSDEGGTVTGRLSMTSPNLQFIPARTADGKKIRRCFLPEEGCEWASLDFNQQEPRLTVHFAAKVGARGGAEAAARYNDDKKLNYHEFAAELTGLPYKRAKILNLAIIYGRGIRATSEEMGMSEEETKAMFAKHAQEMPFVKELSDKCQRTIMKRARADVEDGVGYLNSLLGRRVRFPYYEPARWELRDRYAEPVRLKAARVKWPGERLVPARMHKALNSLIQPSAADQTKAAMRAVLQSGYGGHVLIQVHDELCCSVPLSDDKRRIAYAMADIMVEAAPLVVPTRVTASFGKNWADVTESEPLMDRPDYGHNW